MTAAHPDLDVPDGDDDAAEHLEALRDLRRARRRNRLREVHWIDALYRVYLTGLGGLAAVVVVSGWFPNEPLTPDQVDVVVDRGPAWIGVVVAVAVGVGLRSGARGGPLNLEPAAVQHELAAPVDRALALRAPALKQLRFLAFTAAVVGGLAGVLASHRLPVHGAVAAVAVGATLAVGIALADGCALVAGGRRLHLPAATALATLVAAWSLVDAVQGWTTSPLTLLGSLALWPLEAAPAGLVAVPLAAVAVAAGLRGLDGLSLEAARRRSGLVSQLRFAVTLQDVRTVVLLRRQLSQERPRTRPWVRLGRGGVLPPVIRWDLHGLLRFPLVRVARMLLLGAAAGLLLGGAWGGNAFLVLPAALAVYVAAYDAVEPIAQEVDHPSRWDALPGNPGVILWWHLAVAAVAMLVVCTVAALAALVLVPATVVVDVGLIVVVPVALAATVAAATSTALGSADMASLNAMGGEVLGAVLVLRMVVPPLLVVGAVAPVLAAGTDPAAVQGEAVSNLMSWALLATFLGALWLRFRGPFGSQLAKLNQQAQQARQAQEAT